MYDRRTLLRTSGVALSALVAGCSGGSSDGETTPTGTPENPRVDMTDGLNFEPQELTVSAGTTVVWETTGSVAHSVTAYEDDLPDGAAYFASGGFENEAAAREAYPTEGSVPQGGTYSHTFETVGEHPYFCIPHESGMRGTVIVE